MGNHRTRGMRLLCLVFVSAFLALQHVVHDVSNSNVKQTGSKEMQIFSTSRPRAQPPRFHRIKLAIQATACANSPTLQPVRRDQFDVIFSNNRGLGRTSGKTKDFYTYLKSAT